MIPRQHHKSGNRENFNFKPLWRALKTTFVDPVLPPRCPVTGEIVEQDAVISAPAWSQMRFVSDPQCVSCGWPFENSFSGAETSLPGDELTSYGLKCTQCLKWPPHYNSSRAVVTYNDASRRLILSLKYGDQHQCARVMARLMMRAACNQAVDLVMPVPLHPRRLIRRRFNQSALLASELAQLMKLDYCPDILVRTRATPPQKDKNSQQRRQNVKKAFLVPEQQIPALKDRRILLIDDVYTTGATVNECARALKNSGAYEVHVLCFARTVRE